MTTPKKSGASLPTSPVAVIGVGALYPGSSSTLGLWRDILAGKDCLTEVPRTHWLAEDYFDPTPGVPDKVYVKRGGFLPEVDFSPFEFGMPPNAVPSTDTAQLLALVVARHVLAEATRGKYESVDRSRMSVVLGVASATELVGQMSGRLQRPVLQHAMRQAGLSDEQIALVSTEFDGCHVPWQESTFPGLLGNVVAGRIANRLDLGGTNAVVDAACGSSLAALSMAVNELNLGQSDLVLTGGVDALNDIFMYMCFAQTGALSLSGDCRPFSDQSDGTMLGEGIGMLALKRLGDAERDGDAIYAVIRGIGSSSDGRAKSIYAPSAQGQTLALRRAYERAGYGPETVGLVEAHGTGTRAGDLAEFTALKSVFEEAGARPRGCALGSLKAQIGHTKAAAGVGGMIKSILALHHKVLPPTIKVRAPNPELKIDESPFYLNTETRPWVGDGSHPRRASVSALGFGGTNFHVALEEYTGPAPKAARLHTSPTELLLLGGATAAELATLCKSTAAACGQPGSLVHLAKRQQLGWDVAQHARLAIVAADEAEAREKLAFAASQLEQHGDTPFTSPKGVFFASGPQAGDIALLFSGQGSQYVGMGRDLAVGFDCVRELWDGAAAAIKDSSGNLAERVFPRPVFDDAARERLESELRATDRAQPAIAATSLGMLRLLTQLGVRAQHVGGHSLGEVTAAVAAGVFDEATGLLIARRRGELVAKASEVPGAMTAVAAGRAVVEQVVAGLEVVLANQNAPLQTVLSGAVPAIEEAERRLAAKQLTVRRLPVATAFHSPLVGGAVAPFRAFLETVPFRPARVPYWANATAARYPDDPAAIRTQLAEAIARPVRFVDEIEAMYAAGARLFVEVGPDGVLGRLVERCLEGRQHLAVSLDSRSRHGVTSLQSALGRLAAAGAPLTFAPLWDGRALPEDPATRPAAKFTLKLSGANYGKPYPPAKPAVRPAPRPVQAASLSAPLPSLASPGASTMKNGTPPPTEPVPTARQESPEPQRFAPAPQPPGPGADAYIHSLERLQAPAIAAHVEFQRLMAESHLAFLRTVESSFQSMAPMLGSLPAPGHAAPPPQAHGYAPPPAYAYPPPQPAYAYPPQQPAYAYAPQQPAYAPPQQQPAAAQAPAPVAVAVAPAAPVAAQPNLYVPPAAPARAAAPAVDRTAVLLAIVAEKTGYPAEMIDTGMDMEADLGIDSIKRVEIMSAMQRAVDDLPEVSSQKMAATRTLAEILVLLGSPAAPAAAPVPAPALKAAAARPAATAKAPAADLRGVLLRIVAEKTGYPAEMIDPAMDMEADLGIDSIKRVEILSAMRRELPDIPEVSTQKMSATRTLAEILSLFGSGAGAPAPIASLSPAAAETPAAVLAPSRRVAVRAFPAPAAGFAIPGLVGSGLIAVTQDGGGVAPALVSLLSAHGVEARVVEAVPPDAVGVIFLGGLRRVDEQGALAVEREAFGVARSVAAKFRERGGLFVTVQDTGGDFGLSARTPARALLAGLGALAKTAGEEWPKARVRAIDLEREARTDDELAAALATELLSGGPELEVGLQADGNRVAVSGVPTEPPAMAREIEPGAVFVATGGARGVTAASLLALASHARPRLLLLGRTALREEPPAFLAAKDEPSLKRIALEEARRAGRTVTPRELGAEVEAILAAREVNGNLQAFRAAGAEVRYAAVDVRDPAALAALLDDVRRSWGPIRGLVHGAGVLADALLEKKTDAQFDRVFDTKILGLRALLAATAKDPLGWICLFSSVAARTGNAGQADYAMANEILNKVAAAEASARGSACRVVSIGWGPWDGGMVTPALREHFKSRGVALLPIDSGAEAFVRELRASPRDDVELVIGGDGGALAGGAARLCGEVVVSAVTHPHLASHRIHGKAVLPMALAIDWFARLGRALVPQGAALRLSELRVVRGVTLAGFDGVGDRFTIESGARTGDDVPLELKDAAGAVRYAATLRLSAAPVVATSLNGHVLGPSPWTTGELYSASTLFHGRDFQLIRAIDGLSEEGARAVLAGTLAASWPVQPWQADPAAIDGALQLAILCGLRSIGQTLPLRIGRIELGTTVTDEPIRCVLRVCSRSPERLVCDASLTTESGLPVAQLVGMELYAVPTGTPAERPAEA